MRPSWTELLVGWLGLTFSQFADLPKWCLDEVDPNHAHRQVQEVVSSIPKLEEPVHQTDSIALATLF